MAKEVDSDFQAGETVAEFPWGKPAVAAVCPSCGPSAGGTPVTVLGKGFTGATAITFGSAIASVFTVVSDTEITVTSPALAAGGTVDVTVSTSKGTSPTSSVDQFTFLTDSTTTQVMMTLAALAANGATERPSGETVEQQQERILAGINAQLTNSALATAANWRAIWVGLTQDRANLVYIAENLLKPLGPPPMYAVCLRGTMLGSPIDTAEDMDVGAILPFGPFVSGGSLGNISQGAMKAFTEIIMGTALMDTLTQLISAQTPGPIIYVTGHSLGGALATTVSLYLAAQTWSPIPTFQVYTFAAPTAGDESFASSFNEQFSQAICEWNQYDVIPNAWQNLVNGGSQTPPTSESVEYFYPGMNVSLIVGEEIKGIVKYIAGKTPSPNPYAQPARQPALNAYFACHDPAPSDITTLDDWLAEVTYQHANNTYLALLGAPPLLSVEPSVASISPISGPAAGGTAITITPPPGIVFSPDSGVDFGVVPAMEVSVASDGSSITATSPPGAGIVDVTVTNMFGTSAVVTADQFTFT